MKLLLCNVDGLKARPGVLLLFRERREESVSRLGCLLGAPALTRSDGVVEAVLAAVGVVAVLIFL